MTVFGFDQVLRGIICTLIDEMVELSDAVEDLHVVWGCIGFK